MDRERLRWERWWKYSALCTLYRYVAVQYSTVRDVNVFIFLKNDRFVMKTTTNNRKRNYRFFKVRFLKMVVFIKLVISLTIVNDDPSLTTSLC